MYIREEFYEISLLGFDKERRREAKASENLPTEDEWNSQYILVKKF